MQLYTNNVQDRYGNALVGASVTIRTGAGDLATLYSDNGVTLASNPLKADSTGEFAFYAANGRYTFTVSAAGMQSEIVSAFELADALELQEAATGGAAVATTKAAEALASANAANDAKNTATAQAEIATDKAAQTAADRLQTGEDRTAARDSAANALTSEQIAVAAQLDITNNWSDKLAEAAVQADIATTGGNEATEQAGISTTQAGLAAAAKTSAEAARDASFVTGPKYATEALGRAAVADGVAFLVQGAGLIAAYEYRRTSSTVSVLIAAHTAEAYASKLAGAWAVGQYSETLETNLAVTATNLTDAVTPTRTISYATDGMTIAQATGSRTILYSTPMSMGGSRSRVTLTQNITALGADSMAGIGIGGVGYAFSTLGRIVKSSTGGVGATLVINLPVLTTGILTVIAELDSSGVLVLSFSQNGVTSVATDTGVSMGAVGIIQRGVMTAKHSAVTEGIGGLLKSQIAAAATPELTAENIKELKALRGFLANLSRYAPVGLTYPIPYGFLAYKIAGLRKFFSNIDLQPLLTEGVLGVVTVYVDPVAGLDTNAGTAAAPYQSIKKALATTGSVIIKAKPGLYDRLTGWSGAAVAGTTVQVVPWGAGEIISSLHHSGLVWTLASGAATYSATITTVGTVFDAGILTADGDYSPLALVASQALVDATPGSYFVSGTTVYVRTANSRAPDANVRVYALTQQTTINNAGLSLYLDSVQFHGGINGMYCTLGSAAYAGTILGKNCSFKYAFSRGHSVNGHWLTIWQNCTAALNGEDGFNYHAIFGSAGPNTIELGCTGRWNGRDASGTNNGSTMHDPDSLAIRVNGSYHHNEARNVHDIGGSMSWNLGCTAGYSRTGYANWCAGLASESVTTTMWLDACTSEGSTPDLEALTGKGIIYTSELVSGGINVGGSDIRVYTA